MRKSIVLIALVLFLTACESDTKIEGRVFNDQNQPIEKVMVQVMSSDIYVMTDENGKFTIDTKERGQELIFKKEGYQMQLEEIKGPDMKITLLKE